MKEHLTAVEREPSNGMSRRTLLKAGAWSAPVIVVAMATPASVASVGAIDPETITIDAFIDGFDHGFLISSSATEVVTVAVSFAARATGVSDTAARLNLISATDTGLLATYSHEKLGGAQSVPAAAIYREIWRDDLEVVNLVATRSGLATFILQPNSSVRFWQTNVVLLGAPTITATVLIDGGDTAVLELP